MGKESVQIPLLVLEGIHNENSGIALVRIEQIVNYPCMAAALELMEVLENERRPPEVVSAAQKAAAEIMGRSPLRVRLEMLNKLLLRSGENADAIVRALRADALPLEAKETCIASPGISKDTKAALIRNAEGGEAEELLEVLRVSGAPDKFDVIWELAGAENKNEGLRAKAMEELARFGDEGAIELFKAALGTRSPILRNQAIMGLIALWSEDSENEVEQILCEHLDAEKVQGIKLNIVQWIGENARHTASQRALLKILATGEDQRLISTAEQAIEKLRERLKAKPARFQSGQGVFAEEEPRNTIPVERVTDASEIAVGDVAEDVKGLIFQLRIGAPAERGEAARSLLLIASVSRDLKELREIEKAFLVAGPEMNKCLRQVRGFIQKIGIPGDGGEKLPARPSKRPTPPRGMGPEGVPEGAKKSPQPG